jgi:hypothetical protein
LLAHPEWVTHAQDNLRRWRERNADAPSLLRCYDEWERVLQRPIDDIRTVLIAPTDEAQRMRQNSPFAGVLPAREVWEIKRTIRNDQSAA